MVSAVFASNRAKMNMSLRRSYPSSVGEPLVAFLLLVAMPFVPSSFLFLVVGPGAPSSVRTLLCFSSHLRRPKVETWDVLFRNFSALAGVDLWFTGIADFLASQAWPGEWNFAESNECFQGFPHSFDLKSIFFTRLGFLESCWNEPSEPDSLRLGTQLLAQGLAYE